MHSWNIVWVDSHTSLLQNSPPKNRVFLIIQESDSFVKSPSSIVASWWFLIQGVTTLNPLFTEIQRLLKVARVLYSWSGSKDLNYVSLYIRQVTLHSISLWAGYLKFFMDTCVVFLCISLIVIRTKIKKNSYFSALTRNEENEKV